MKNSILKVLIIILFSITSCTDSAEEPLESNNIENLDTLSRIDPNDDGTLPPDDQE